MRLKTFFASSMQEVMSKVRKELGNNALIISVVEEEAGVRVTAAFDQEAPASKEAPSLTGYLQDPETTLMQLNKCLEHHGLAESLRDTLVKKATLKYPDQLSQGLFPLFEKLFYYEPLSFLKSVQDGNRCIMAIGTAGAGKSVTLAKIASEVLMAGKPLVMATLDIHKAGAIEQLEAYAHIMKIPLAALNSPKELQLFMEEVPKDAFVLVDTPGINPFLKEDLHFISQCVLATRHPPYWIVPSGCDIGELMEMAEVFKDLGVTNVIHTRCDVARRFGGLLAVLSHSQLRLCALSQGGAVGHRLVPAKPTVLHELLQANQFTQVTHPEPHFQEEMQKPEEPKWIRQIRGAKA